MVLDIAGEGQVVKQPWNEDSVANKVIEVITSKTSTTNGPIKMSNFNDTLSQWIHNPPQAIGLTIMEFYQNEHQRYWMALMLVLSIVGSVQFLKKSLVVSTSSPQTHTETDSYRPVHPVFHPSST